MHRMLFIYIFVFDLDFISGCVIFQFSVFILHIVTIFGT